MAAAGAPRTAGGAAAAARLAAELAAAEEEGIRPTPCVLGFPFIKSTPGLLNIASLVMRTAHHRITRFDLVNLVLGCTPLCAHRYRNVLGWRSAKGGFRLLLIQCTSERLPHAERLHRLCGIRTSPHGRRYASLRQTMGPASAGRLGHDCKPLRYARLQQGCIRLLVSDRPLVHRPHDHLQHCISHSRVKSARSAALLDRRASFPISRCCAAAWEAKVQATVGKYFPLEKKGAAAAAAVSR